MIITKEFTLDVELGSGIFEQTLYTTMLFIEVEVLVLQDISPTQFGSQVLYEITCSEYTVQYEDYDGKLKTLFKQTLDEDDLNELNGDIDRWVYDNTQDLIDIYNEGA